jgi:hypothetical protein
MAHQTTIPPPETGGGGLVAGDPVLVTITWVPSHDLTPDQEAHIRHKLERLQERWQAKAAAVVAGADHED